MNSNAFIKDVRIGYHDHTGKTIVQFYFGDELMPNFPRYIKYCCELCKKLGGDLVEIGASTEKDFLGNSMQYVFLNIPKSDNEYNKVVANELMESVKKVRISDLPEKLGENVSKNIKSVVYIKLWYDNKIKVKFEYDSEILYENYGEYIKSLFSMFSKYNIYKCDCQIKRKKQIFKFDIMFSKKVKEKQVNDLIVLLKKQGIINIIREKDFS